MKRIAFALGLTTCLTSENLVHAATGTSLLEEIRENGVFLPVRMNVKGLQHRASPKTVQSDSILDLLSTLRQRPLSIPPSPQKKAPTSPVLQPDPPLHSSLSEWLSALRQRQVSQEKAAIATPSVSDRPSAYPQGKPSEKPSISLWFNIARKKPNTKQTLPLKLTSPSVSTDKAPDAGSAIRELVPSSSKSNQGTVYSLPLMDTQPMLGSTTSSLDAQGSLKKVVVPSDGQTPSIRLENSSSVPLQIDWVAEKQSLKDLGWTSFDEESVELALEHARLVQDERKKKRSRQELDLAWERFEERRDNFLAKMATSQALLLKEKKAAKLADRGIFASPGGRLKSSLGTPRRGGYDTQDRMPSSVVRNGTLTPRHSLVQPSSPQKPLRASVARTSTPQGHQLPHDVQGQPLQRSPFRPVTVLNPIHEDDPHQPPSLRRRTPSSHRRLDLTSQQSNGQLQPPLNQATPPRNGTPTRGGSSRSGNSAQRMRSQRQLNFTSGQQSGPSSQTVMLTQGNGSPLRLSSLTPQLNRAHVQPTSMSTLQARTVLIPTPEEEPSDARDLSDVTQKLDFDVVDETPSRTDTQAQQNSAMNSGGSDLLSALSLLSNPLVQPQPQPQREVDLSTNPQVGNSTDSSHVSSAPLLASTGTDEQEYEQFPLDIASIAGPGPDSSNQGNTALPNDVFSLREVDSDNDNEEGSRHQPQASAPVPTVDSTLASLSQLQPISPLPPLTPSVVSTPTPTIQSRNRSKLSGISASFNRASSLARSLVSPLRAQGTGSAALITPLTEDQPSPVAPFPPLTPAPREFSALNSAASVQMRTPVTFKPNASADSVIRITKQLLADVGRLEKGWIATPPRRSDAPPLPTLGDSPNTMIKSLETLLKYYQDI